MNSRIKVCCLSISIVAPPHLSSTSMGISFDSSFPDPFCFLSDRSFDFERERQQLCQRVQFIYLHSSLSFFVPSYPRSLSITGLNADGTLSSLESSTGDSGTVADTSPSLPSTSQDELTSGATAGVIQDITDAPEISSVLPPSTTTVTVTTVAPPTTTATTATTPPTTTAAITPSTSTAPEVVVSDHNPQEGSILTSSNTPTTTTWWNYVGWGSIPTISESAGVMPAEGQSRGVDAEAEGGVGVRVDVREEVGAGVYVRGVGPDREEPAEIGEQSQDVIHMTGKSVVSDNVISDSPAPPPPTSTATTWLTPWSWYYPSAPTNLEFHSDAEKAQHAAAAGEEHCHGDRNGNVEDLQHDSPTGAQPNVTAGFSFDATTTTDASSPNGAHPPQISDPSINLDPNPVASTITSHTSGWASFFSSRSLMVKTLGYGSAPVGLIEDNVKRDENGIEVMDLDDGDGDEGEGDEREVGTERGRDVHRKEGGASTVEDVAGAGAMFKANAKRTKNRIVSSAPLLAVSAGADVDGKRQSVVAVANPTSLASATPKKGNSGTSTPALGPSPSTSVSNKHPVIAPSTSTLANDTPSKPFAGSSTLMSPPGPPANSNIKPASIPTPTPTKPTPTNKSTSKSRTSSPTPSKKSTSIPPAPPPPNLVLPTWDDTFYTAPRDVLPQVEETRADAGDQGVGGKLLGRTMRFMSSVLWAKDGVGAGEGGGSGLMRGGSMRGKEKETERARVREGSADTARRTGSVGVGGGGESLVERDRRERFREFGRELPKAWTILEGGRGDDVKSRGFAASRSRSRVSSSSSSSPSLVEAKAKAKGTTVAKGKVGAEEEVDKASLYDVLRGCRRVVVIGVHGWFPGAMIRSVLGEVSLIIFCFRLLILHMANLDCIIIIFVVVAHWDEL